MPPHKTKMLRFTFSHFLGLLVAAMFIVTIILSTKILNNDYCNCPEKEPIVQYISTEPKKIPIFESKHKLAVLVPFRDRFEELQEFVPYMNSFLNEQRINHDIFILNQVDTFRFNRASLINVGYLQTKAEYDYIAMHDVDLLPLNKNLKYRYPEQPHHLAGPKLHPRYHYEKFIGGILLINREQYNLVNGLSNKYWGWGLEDDEFYVRLKEAHLNVTRPEGITSNTTNTFKHIHGKHRRRDTTKCYNQREVTRKRDRQTGLHDLKYSIVNYVKMTVSEAPCTIINIKLKCDFQVTPWCDCSNATANKIKTLNPPP